MAIEPRVAYPGQTLTGDPAFPYGKARNITVAGDGTGSPLEELMLNDIWGHQQDLLDRGGLVPNGEPDEVGTSQYSTAIQQLARAAAHRVAIANHLNRTTGNASAQITGICAGVSGSIRYLVGVGSAAGAPIVTISPDGDVWTSVAPTSGVSAWNRIVYTGARFVAIGNGDIQTSTNPVTWVPQVTTGALADICKHGARLVIVGFDLVRTSDDDGLTWTSRTPAAGADYMGGVATNGTRLVAVGTNNGFTDDRVQTSDDNGVSWVGRSTPASAATVLSKVVWTGYAFVAVGDAGVIMVSRDGTTWTLVANASGFTGYFRDVACTGALVVAVGDGGEIQTAQMNGRGWSKVWHRNATGVLHSVGFSSEINIGAFGGTAGALRRTQAW